MAVIVVGKKQPRSERRNCLGCNSLIEYQRSDVRIENGCKFITCPVRSCSKPMYLGTASEQELKNGSR